VGRARCARAAAGGEARMYIICQGGALGVLQAALRPAAATVRHWGGR
jgi:hypothetical protein